VVLDVGYPKQPGSGPYSTGLPTGSMGITATAPGGVRE
jgi:hypothetical protein